MNSKLKKQEKGFTIIEVLIVLAIAGLIMLIVFMAVPALQRNSRNTQRKNDVSSLVGAYNEAVNNNNGKAPADAAKFVADVVPNAKFGIYDTSGDETAQAAVFEYRKAPTVKPTNTNTEKVVIATNWKCQGNDATNTGASARSGIVLYAVEKGSGDASTGTQQCTEL